MILGSKLRKDEGITVVILPLLIAAVILVSQLSPVAALMIIIIPAAWIIARFNLRYFLLSLITLLLPFSFEAGITENFSLMVPTEPLIAIALITLVWDILSTPLLLKSIFRNESRWIIPLLASFIITTLFSSIALVSIKFALLNIAYILVFFVWQKHLFRKRPEIFPKLMVLYTLSLTLVAFIALYRFQQYEWNPVTIKGIFAPFYKDNTIFGATVAMVAIFWLSCSLQANMLTVRMLNITTGLFYLFVVWFSNSRAAIFSIAFSCIVFLILILRIRLIHLLTGILVAAVFVLGFRNELMDTLRDNRNLSHNPDSPYTEHILSSANITTDDSNRERINRWIAGMRMFAEKPVMGFGPGTYQFSYIPFQKPEFTNRLTVSDPWHIPENSGGTAHSEYILALSEMGILGIMALLIYLIRLGTIAFVKARNLPNHLVLVISFCALSTYLFHALFNNFLSTDKFAFLFWGMAAWMLSNYETATHEQ